MTYPALNGYPKNKKKEQGLGGNPPCFDFVLKGL
jgi:hypothetical protein